MKKYLILLLTISIALSSSCKKEEKNQVKDEPVGTKYSKFRACAYSSAELNNKDCLLVIEKTEPVEFYSSEEKTIKNKKVKVAKIKTTDGKILFMDEDFLAEKVIVFTEDLSPYTRNNLASSTYGEIAKGMIGFVIDEKGSWTKIYVGKVKDKWITQHWVNSGFSADPALIADALKYGRAIKLLKKVQKQKKVKPDEIEKARKILSDFSGSQNLFANLSKDALIKWDEADKKKTDDSTNDNKNNKTDEKKTPDNNENKTSGN